MHDTRTMYKTKLLAFMPQFCFKCMTDDHVYVCVWVVCVCVSIDEAARFHGHEQRQACQACNARALTSGTDACIYMYIGICLVLRSNTGSISTRSAPRMIH